MTSYDPQSWSPAVDAEALANVVDQLRDRGLHVVAEQPMGPWTTLGAGGAARFFAEVTDDDQLSALINALAQSAESDVPLLVLGRGSNMLISDSGWPSFAIRLGASFKTFLRAGTLVTARAGASMPALAAWTATQGLSGLEFAAGIPATVGGSVRMNAGAHGSEVAALLVDVDVAVPGDGIRTIDKAELDFAYRRSVLPPRSVIVAARWQLARADPEVIRSTLDELRAWRRATQPLRQRNCGSVFTNPPGDSAGRLVDAAGLKGLRRGSAQVSEQHANFIVVQQPARAADVYALISVMRKEVHRAGGPLLRPEVRVIGSFDAADGSDHGAD